MTANRPCRQKASGPGGEAAPLPPDGPRRIIIIIIIINISINYDYYYYYYYVV